MELRKLLNRVFYLSVGNIKLLRYASYNAIPSILRQIVLKVP